MSTTDGTLVDKRILLTAVGFRPAMILPLAQATKPDEVSLLSGKHPTVIQTEHSVVEHLRKDGIPVHIAHVDDWDVLGWSKAILMALDRHKDDEVTINLTAGHGLALAMLAIHAAQRSLPVVCYDWETFAKTGEHPKDLQKYMHPHSPAAVLNLDSTQPIDRKLLAELLKGPQSVTNLMETFQKIPQSTISTSLSRLVAKGFLAREIKGRNRFYSLRPGLHPMIANAVR
jgi:DNA-binding transcriptional ArsR family regulator